MQAALTTLPSSGLFADRPGDDAAGYTRSRNPRAVAQTVESAEAGGRPLQTNPTACEREDSLDELEFMQAIQEYKRCSGRQFPTWSEVLEVLQTLGYRKVDPGCPA